MTDPDGRPQPVAEAITAANLWICRAWQAALAEGVRHGIELSAQACDASAKKTRAQAVVTDTDTISIATAEFLRDKLREFALTVEDPPMIQEGGE